MAAADARRRRGSTGGRSMPGRPGAAERARRREDGRDAVLDRRPVAAQRTRLRAWRAREPARHRRRHGAAHARTIGAVRFRDAWVAHGPDPRCRRQRGAAVRAPARTSGPTSTRGSSSRRARRTGGGCRRAGVSRLVAHGSGTWRLADAQRALAALLALGRGRSSTPAERPARSCRTRLEVRLPPARRDQGRPVALAQPHDHDLFVDEHRRASTSRSRATARRTSFTAQGGPARPACRASTGCSEAAEVPPDDRDLVIVAPTWRSWLAPAARARHPAPRPAAASSGTPSTCSAWSALLAPPEIAEACRERRGWRLGFMPHPNLQATSWPASAARPT